MKAFRRLMERRIGINPLPVYPLLWGLAAAFVLTGKMPSDILANIALLALGGFTCAEIGKHLPVLRHVGAAAILATFVPSYLAFAHLLPDMVTASIADFTKSSNFLYLFISSIIVGSILGILIAGALNFAGKRYPHLTGEGRLQPDGAGPAPETALYLVGVLTQRLWSWPAPTAKVREGLLNSTDHQDGEIRFSIRY